MSLKSLSQRNTTVLGKLLSRNRYEITKTETPNVQTTKP